MKKFLLAALVALLSFSTVGVAFPNPNPGGGTGGTGTTPHTIPDASAPTKKAELSTPKKAKLTPGGEHTNGDGVTVVNDENSSGNVTIAPALGDANSETTVKTTTKFQGSITGIDSNDTVNLSSSNTVTVSGIGGNISLGGGSVVTMINGAGTSNMYVSLPSGGTMTISPGSQVVIST